MEIQYMSDTPEESYQKLKKILEKQNHITYTMEEIRGGVGDLLRCINLILCDYCGIVSI